MQKKRSPKKSSDGPPRWKTHRVGSGITKKTDRWFPLPSPEWATSGASEESLAKEWKARLAAGLSDHPPSKEEYLGYDGSIAWARSTLEKANLPTDPRRMYPRPKGGSCRLLNLVEQLGLKELHAPEWFAAKILTCWHEALTARSDLRNPHLSEKKREFHLSQFELHMGELAKMATTWKMKFRWEEKVLKHGNLGKGGSKGGKHEKRRLGIEQAIRDRLAKPPLSARALWDQLIRYTEEEPLHVGDYAISGIDADKWIEDQKLLQDGGPSDSAKYLKFRAFKNYVSRLKK